MKKNSTLVTLPSHSMAALVLTVAITYYSCTSSQIKANAFTVVSSQPTSRKNQKKKCTLEQQRRRLCQQETPQTQKQLWNNNNNNNAQSLPQLFEATDRGESFALRMSKHQEDVSNELVAQEQYAKENNEPLLMENNNVNSPNLNNSNFEEDDHSNRFQRAAVKRRKFLHALVTSAAISTLTTNRDADAFESFYPSDLDIADTKRKKKKDVTSDEDEDVLSGITLDLFNNDRRIAAKRAAVTTPTAVKPKRIPNEKDYISSVVWGGALWLLTGSRSNPLVQPLANLIYGNGEDENAQQQPQWLKDRNDGLFSPLPPGFLLLMGLIFTALGVLANSTVLVLSGDDNITASLQLAGVSLIGGGALELGRIATGEKEITRNEQERDALLEEEFATFADKRLIAGGNCHKSDVIKSFRRYYAKYRVENINILSNLEIERLTRKWNREQGYEEMTSAGFYKSFQIDSEADAALTANSPF